MKQLVVDVSFFISRFFFFSELVKRAQIPQAAKQITQNPNCLPVIARFNPNSVEGLDPWSLTFTELKKISKMIL